MKIVIRLGNLAQNYQRCFAIFGAGLGLFMIGLTLFYLSAKHYDAQPLLAELLTLVALALFALGVITALVGYLSLTYYRWYHFFKKRSNTKLESEQD
ncbi:hypothetical protein NBRC116188_12280 [Oceaniserpentilla sp. 4NH20-0058]|uniref:hypothetical protein n=1 Tax=Oceaniserpentilla sp. 4NH20-0058 TaxID=3127660 RepID=UPI0031076B48